MRGATYLHIKQARVLDISIHAPHEGSDLMEILQDGGPGLFQSTLPMRGATRDEIIEGRLPLISIHAPHEGSDHVSALCSDCGKISIHAPHEGSDAGTDFIDVTAYGFQSTLPMRGATGMSSCFCFRLKFQSTLPMRGATFSLVMRSQIFLFQSTLPMRGATALVPSPSRPMTISIHAPHEGSDPGFLPGAWRGWYFNPRSP